MTITFDEQGTQTTWTLTAEEERLLNVVRAKLTVADPDTKQQVPKFDSIRELIHTNIIDTFFVPVIQEETRLSFQASLDSTITTKIDSIPKPPKVAIILAQEKTLFEKFKSFIGMEA